MEELRSNRVQEDVISKTEIRVKELENSLRVEERSVKDLLCDRGQSADFAGVPACVKWLFAATLQVCVSVQEQSNSGKHQQ